MAALIGGFALGNMNLGKNTDLERGIYMLCVVAVHGCTCSALTSALLYAGTRQSSAGGSAHGTVQQQSDDASCRA